MYKKIIVGFYLIQLVAFNAVAQSTDLYPTNWFTGMRWNKVQVLVHDKTANFNTTKLSLQYPGVVLQQVHNFPNQHYLAVDLLITSAARPGTVKFNFSGTLNKTVDFPLLNRRTGNGQSFAQGVTSADLAYLLIPDRFSNGDKTNDIMPGMLDQSLRRDTVFQRHGGDLRGVINHLDYLKDLGVTSLWMTPVWENNMPNRTEHGYAITNQYKVDPRLGTNETYKELSSELHKRGMKLIQDAVYNHVGIQHFTFVDKPSDDWYHQWPNFTQTTYKDQVLFDPYASEKDRKQMSDGWFTREMPDLNQANPFVANFLIEQALWAAETFGIDGWRIDTYAYNDLDFMNRCNKALYDDFPKMSIFGETWVHGVINQSYFCENNLNIPFKSNLQNTTDFQMLFYGIQPALTEKFGWTEGVNKLYTTTAQDLVYKNPMGQVLFLDNHDIARFYSVVGEDTAKYKVALSWLLTFRGVPQMYYGMENLMTGYTNPDGNVRKDFMGGWAGDKVNKFTAEGRTAKENSIFNFIRTLANFRKSSSALQSGNFMQYLPQDGLYVYFRYDGNQTIACVMNTGSETKNVNLLEDYKERTIGYVTAQNVVSKESMGLKFSIKPMEMFVLELK